MENCEVLDIIISFIKSYKNQSKDSEPFIHSKYKNEDKWIFNTGYLFNQIMRQIDIPQERYLLSKAAKKMWDSITDEPITNFYYREKVVAKFDGAIINEFKGADKFPYRTRTLKAGDSFIYNDVFHQEHLIPIKVIIDELIALDDEELDYEHVNDILSKMYICRILKTEDRKIDSKYNRSSNKNDVISNVYKKAGIEVVE